MLHERIVTTQTWPPHGSSHPAPRRTKRIDRDAARPPRPTEPPPSEVGLERRELGWSLVALAAVIVGALVACGLTRTLMHTLWP